MIKTKQDARECLEGLRDYTLDYPDDKYMYGGDMDECRLTGYFPYDYFQNETYTITHNNGSYWQHWTRGNESWIDAVELTLEEAVKEVYRLRKFFNYEEIKAKKEGYR